MPDTLKKITNRTAWIDTAKALAMVLIVYGHIDVDSYAQSFVYAFHLPVFIFLSGLCFNSGPSFKIFIKKKASRILVPYLFFGIFAIAAYLVLGSAFANGELISLKDCLTGLLIGNAKSNRMIFNLHLWYLPFIFVMSVMFYGMKKLSDCITEKAGVKKVYGYIFIFVFSLAVSAFVINRFTDFYLPFGIDNAVRSMPFFALGFLMKSSESFCADIDRKDFRKLFMNLAVFVITTVLLIYFADKNIRHDADGLFKILYHRDIYGVPLYFYGAAFSGIFAVESLSKLIPAFRWLTYFGRNTLAVLIMQKFAILPIRLLADRLPDGIGNSFLFYSVSTVIAIIICLAADCIIKKYLPFLYGMKYKKTN